MAAGKPGLIIQDFCLLPQRNRYIWNVEQAGLVCFKVVRCLAINGDTGADGVIHSNKAIGCICIETKRVSKFIFYRGPVV